MKHITGAAAIAVLLSAPAAFAQTPVQPQARSKVAIGQRVRDGGRLGQLTRGELGAIRGRLRAFRGHAKELRAAGQLSRESRAALRQEWRRASRLVFALRHNRIHRAPR